MRITPETAIAVTAAAALLAGSAACSKISHDIPGYTIQFNGYCPDNMTVAIPLTGAMPLVLGDDKIGIPGYTGNGYTETHGTFVWCKDANTGESAPLDGATMTVHGQTYSYGHTNGTPTGGFTVEVLPATGSTVDPNKLGGPVAQADYVKYMTRLVVEVASVQGAPVVYDDIDGAVMLASE